MRTCRVVLVDTPEAAWKRVEEYTSTHATCWWWTFEPPYVEPCGKCSKCRAQSAKERRQAARGKKAS